MQNEIVENVQNKISCYAIKYNPKRTPGRVSWTFSQRNRSHFQVTGAFKLLLLLLRMNITLPGVRPVKKRITL